MKKFIKNIKKIKKRISENKAINIVYKIIKTILTVILVLFLVVIIVQRISKNNVSVGGFKVFTIVSNSMVPKYVIGDILISKETDPANINIGDDVVYYGEKGDMANLIVTHKVVNKRFENGEYYFITKGLANEIADPEIESSQIYGKIIYRTIVLSFLGEIMSNIVLYYIIFFIVAILVSYQIVKIIYEYKEDEDEDEEDKDNLESN